MRGFTMKKRVLAIIMASAMVIGLSACGSSAESGAAGGSAQGESAAGTYTVGICQALEHESLDAATEGFEAALKDKLGDSVEIELQNAQGESANNTTICNQFVSANVDLIMANATPALQAASQATADIPVLGTSVTDYASALGMSDFTGTTGTNVSGTSDLAPIDEQENIFVELLPEAKKVGILYCSAEPNSIYQSDAFEAEAKADGIETVVYTAADSNEIQTVTTKAVQECDALYIPTDNTFAAAIGTVKNIVQPAGIPVVTGWGDVDTGIAAVSISYYDLGYQTGLMAYEILANGANPGEMAVETADSTTKTVNAALCESLGITIPEGYEAAQ